MIALPEITLPEICPIRLQELRLSRNFYYLLGFSDRELHIDTRRGIDAYSNFIGLRRLEPGLLHLHGICSGWKVQNGIRAICAGANFLREVGSRVFDDNFRVWDGCSRRVRHCAGDGSTILG